MTMRYVAKPVEVDAVEWTGSRDDVPHEWLALDLLYVNDAGQLVVRTHRGPAVAYVGEFIIRGRSGELYPIPPATFHDKYEPAGGTS